MTIDPRWKSRKLWVVIVFTLLAIFNSQFNFVDWGVLGMIANVAGAFIGVEGAADIVSRYKTV